MRRAKKKDEVKIYFIDYPEHYMITLADLFSSSPPHRPFLCRRIDIDVIEHGRSTSTDDSGMTAVQ